MSIDDFVDHLYTYLYVYMVVSGIMARLYWRIKQAGRWTWKPVKWSEMIHRTAGDFRSITCTQEEEE